MMHDQLLPDTNLTKHFKYKELNTRMAPCKDFVVLSLYQMALFLEMVRLSFGKPIKVNSGFRSAKHNEEVGGVKNSMHLLGKAVDICPVSSTSVPLDFFNSLSEVEKPNAKNLFYTAEYQRLCFCVDRLGLPDKHYIKYYPQKHFIHIHFGDRDENPLNLLPYFPFTKV